MQAGLPTMPWARRLGSHGAFPCCCQQHAQQGGNEKVPIRATRSPIAPANRCKRLEKASIARGGPPKAAARWAPMTPSTCLALRLPGQRAGLGAGPASRRLIGAAPSARAGWAGARRRRAQPPALASAGAPAAPGPRAAQPVENPRAALTRLAKPLAACCLAAAVAALVPAAAQAAAGAGAGAAAAGAGSSGLVGFLKGAPGALGVAGGRCDLQPGAGSAGLLGRGGRAALRPAPARPRARRAQLRAAPGRAPWRDHCAVRALVLGLCVSTETSQAAALAPVCSWQAPAP